MNVVVCLSGGIDSTVLLAHLLAEHHHVQCFALDYGQRHRRELDAAVRIAQDYNVAYEVAQLRGRMFDGSLLTAAGDSVVVPNRNAVLISLATAVALRDDADAVAIGCHQGDSLLWPDCRPGFLDAMQQVLFRCDDRRVILLRPFIRSSKIDIIRLGCQLEVDFDQTWSCYLGLQEPCGQCPACVSRREAFFLAGVTAPAWPS